MTRRHMFPMALAMVLGLMLTQGVCAKTESDPKRDRADRVARRCTRHVNRLAVRYDRHNRHVAALCVKVIERQLTNDQPDRAARLTEHCKRRISRGGNAVVNRLHKICDRYTKILGRHDASEQAAALKQACDEALTKVREAMDIAVAAIDAALDL